MSFSLTIAQGLGLYPNIRLAGYRLREIHGGPIVTTKHYRYHYQTTLILEAIELFVSPKELFKEMKKYLKPRVIYTQDRPFTYSFRHLKLSSYNDNEVILVGTSQCERIFGY